MDLNSDFNLYKKFFMVVKCGSFAKAAQNMYCTQPGLSKAVSQLEDNLDTKLLYRNSKGIKLTEAGEEVYEYIKKSFSIISIGEKKIKEENSLLTGEISIGIQSHLAQFFLFPYIKKFREQYPSIKVNVRSRPTSELLQNLEENNIDFMIDTSPIDSIYNNIKVQSLFDLKNCFISKKEENIKSIKELVNKDVILPVKSSSHRKQLSEFLENKNVFINPIMTIETTGMLKNAVKSEMGIGYILEIAVEKELKNKELFKVEVEEELPKLKLNLIYIDKYLTRIPTLFINMIKNDYEDLIE